LTSTFFGAGAGAGAAAFGAGAAAFAGSLPSSLALRFNNSSTLALMASLSALFSFKSLTSFPTFNISASKSVAPAVGASAAGASTFFGAGAGVADGLLSLERIMVKFLLCVLIFYIVIVNINVLNLWLIFFWSRRRGICLWS
jgi:hypothetical protein